MIISSEIESFEEIKIWDYPDALIYGFGVYLFGISGAITGVIGAIVYWIDKKRGKSVMTRKNDAKRP